MVDVLKIQDILRLMPGGSQSVLGSCSDGHLYVLKASKNLQGPNVLANEYIGANLLEALDLPIPNWRTARMAPAVQVKCHLEASWHSVWDCHGSYFASRFLKPPSIVSTPSLEARVAQLVENRQDFIGALVFDVWAGSTDVRQAIYEQDHQTSGLRAKFIDQGHAFGGPFWTFDGPPGAAFCRQSSLYEMVNQQELIEAWKLKLKLVIPTLLPSILSTVPKTWYTGDKSTLEKRLMRRLAHIDRHMDEAFCCFRNRN